MAAVDDGPNDGDWLAPPPPRIVDLLWAAALVGLVVAWGLYVEG